MKGPCGYGRYDDDPDCIGCPRAKTDMTPCIVRDGQTALADDRKCVGCSADPKGLVDELVAAGVQTEHIEISKLSPMVRAKAWANHLKYVVWKATEPKG